MGRLNDGSLTIVVADTLPMQMAQLAEGLANGNVGQRPFEMGYMAMHIMKDIAEGKAVDGPDLHGASTSATNANHATCLAQ